MRYAPTRGKTALILLTGLAATACGVGTGASESTSGESEIRFWSTEPTTLLGHEDPGSQVAMAMCANLMEVNDESGRLEPLAAESVKTDDGQHYTIKLRDDWTFQDGSPVTASSFVDAWNKTAYGPNAWAGNGYFVNFEGYDELNPADGSTPKTKTMSGVRAVGPDTITVTTKQPDVDLPEILSTSATCPLPEQAFSHPEAYEKKPISNGPYRFVSWEHNTSITLKKWDGFQGGDGFTGNADRLTGSLYEDQKAAFTALKGGELDIIRNMPPELQEDAKALGDDQYYEVREEPNQMSLAVPDYIETLKDPRVREAISLAIDRESIANGQLRGGVTPADDLTTPMFPSYREGSCTACSFDPALARKLLAEARGFDGKLTILYQPGSFDQLVLTLADQISKNLRIEVTPKPIEAAAYEEAVANKELTGLYFSLWGVSYVSDDQYLGQYRTGGDGNTLNAYSNPTVDRALDTAKAELDPDKRVTLYQHAEDLILEDLPSIPLFYPHLYVSSSSCVDPVDALGDVQYYRAEYTC